MRMRSSWLITIVVLMLSLEARGQSDVVQNAHWGWKNVCRSEEAQSMRVARFTGFLEGSYGITAPRIWQMSMVSFRELSFERMSKASDKAEHEAYPLCKVDMSTKSIVVTTKDPGIDNVLFECKSKDGSTTWKRELTNVFPKVVFQGSGQLICEVIAADKHILLFGRIGEIRLFVALSENNGKIVDHFAFLADSETNLAK